MGMLVVLFAHVNCVYTFNKSLSSLLFDVCSLNGILVSLCSLHVGMCSLGLQRSFAAVCIVSWLQHLCLSGCNAKWEQLGKCGKRDALLDAY